ncbi:hypothetical protein JTE90_018616 [Oedothorax gibbosus]|uniref:HTH OST-type domain-containing protein n=1 Tax=Oedothorax gibbosus TaxID=931172 RepID=A0AAV6UMI1_9ARAC|nr:hypothetical protein JTE90_018616 [Oedothorax gibbosus]
MPSDSAPSISPPLPIAAFQCLPSPLFYYPAFLPVLPLFPQPTDGAPFSNGQSDTVVSSVQSINGVVPLLPIFQLVPVYFPTFPFPQLPAPVASPTYSPLHSGSSATNSNHSSKTQPSVSSASNKNKLPSDLSKSPMPILSSATNSNLSSNILKSQVPILSTTAINSNLSSNTQVPVASPLTSVPKITAHSASLESCSESSKRLIFKLLGMEKPELKDFVCCNLRSVTQSIKGGVPLNRLERDYQDLIGSSIPYRNLGYNSLESFIRSIPSVIRLTKSRDGYLMAEAVADLSTAHIASLISRQKQTSKAKAIKRFSSRRGGFAPKDAYRGERNSYVSYSAAKSSGKSYKQDFKPSQGYHSRPQNATPPLNVKIEIKDTNHIPVDKTPALTTTKPLPAPPTARLPSPAADKPKTRASSKTRGYEIAPRFQRLLQQKVEARKEERFCTQDSSSSSNFYTARSSETPPQTPSPNPNPYAFTASSIASGNSPPSITSPIDDIFIPPPTVPSVLLNFTAFSIPSANSSSSSRTSPTDDIFIPPPVKPPALLPFTATSIANSSSSRISPTDDIFIPPPAERPSLLPFTPTSIARANFSSYQTSPTDDIFIPPPTEALISPPTQTSYSPVKVGSNGFASARARSSLQLRARMNAETFSQQLESARMYSFQFIELFK